MSSRVVVSSASSADLPAACRALYPHVPEPGRTERSARTLTLVSAGEIDPSGLLVARVDGNLRPAGAILVQPTPGNAAVLWPPRAEPGPDRAAVVDALAAAAVGFLRSRGAKVAQLMLPPDERDAAEPLERVGFHAVTQIAYLCRPLSPDDRTASDSADSPLRFVPVRGPDPAFGELLLATYDGSLDCPELNGARSAAEVLAGYAGQVDTHAGEPVWFRVEAAGRPVGVVLLGRGPQPGVTDLMYLGLLPKVRGRRWGGTLLRFALARAADFGAEWITLSVDVRNAPARAMYARERFREYDVQDVFLWISAPG
ncbi:MAG: GNAT family N-acetyltransferase [Fimbriiglobus sp.]